MVLAGVVLAALLLAGSAASASQVRYVPDTCPEAPLLVDEAALLRCYAPVFIAHGTDAAHNRLGSPHIRSRRWRRSHVYVDPGDPAIYSEVRADSVGGRDVLQLVYRAHFERIPFRLRPSFYEAHRNVGLLALITLDAKSGEPLFLTVVHTCGCYRAVVPTRNTPRTWLPAGAGEPQPTQRIYGHTLPGELPAPVPGRTRLVLELEPHSHRVRDMRVEPVVGGADVQPVVLRPIALLRVLPVEGAPGKRESMFYKSGPLRGHVRGAWNAWEGLFVFSWVALDPTVGMDKDFGHPDDTGTPFYTSIRFWKHDASRLDRFESMLREMGYEPGPEL